MVKKYILVITIFIIFLFSTTVFKYGKEIIAIDAKDVFDNKTIGKTKLKESIEENELYLIKVYFPKTEYDNLNEHILNIIAEVKNNFLEQVNNYGENPNECRYELNITFNQYEYKSCISFAFDVRINLCGPHPYNYIFSVNYDTISKKVITINDLIKKDSEFLNKVSIKSYEFLKENINIKEYSNDENLKEGLKAISSNFENFIFDNDKIIFFINTYQVAPYVAGNFEVAIPYNEIFEEQIN